MPTPKPGQVVAVRYLNQACVRFAIVTTADGTEHEFMLPDVRGTMAVQLTALRDEALRQATRQIDRAAILTGAIARVLT